MSAEGTTITDGAPARDDGGDNESDGGDNESSDDDDAWYDQMCSQSSMFDRADDDAEGGDRDAGRALPRGDAGTDGGNRDAGSRPTEEDDPDAEWIEKVGRRGNDRRDRIDRGRTRGTFCNQSSWSGWSASATNIHRAILIGDRQR